MNNQTRQKSLIYFTLIIVGMILLAASLPELQFKPGLPIPGAEVSQESTIPENEYNSPVIEGRLLLQFLLALIFVAILIAFIIRLVYGKKNYKEIFKLAGGLLGVFCLFLLLNQIEFAAPVASVGESQGTKTLPPFTHEIAPIGEPPGRLFQFVMIVMLLGAVLLLAWLLYQFLHRPQKDNALASEANAALKAIEDGDDLRNVIVRYYLQMARITKEKRGIEREDSVTPREFEYLLAAKGIPILPIHQLTSLFEKVRYGNKALELQDEQTAIECLSAIRNSCE